MTNNSSNSMPMPHKTPLVMVRRQFAVRASPTSRHLSARQRSEIHPSKNR